LVAVRQAKSFPFGKAPAPLFGLHFNDGSSVALVDAAPVGSTTAAESYDLKANTLIDERFRFGAIGAEEVNDNTSIGFWWPGSEGGTTYRAKPIPADKCNNSAEGIIH
jgi:hypothetical protein